MYTSTCTVQCNCQSCWCCRCLLGSVWYNFFYCFSFTSLHSIPFVNHSIQMCAIPTLSHSIPNSSSLFFFFFFLCSTLDCLHHIYNLISHAKIYQSQSHKHSQQFHQHKSLCTNLRHDIITNSSTHTHNIHTIVLFLVALLAISLRAPNSTNDSISKLARCCLIYCNTFHMHTNTFKRCI